MSSIDFPFLRTSPVVPRVTMPRTPLAPPQLSVSTTPRLRNRFPSHPKIPSIENLRQRRVSWRAGGEKKHNYQQHAITTADIKFLRRPIGPSGAGFRKINRYCVGPSLRENVGRCGLGFRLTGFGHDATDLYDTGKATTGC